MPVKTKPTPPTLAELLALPDEADIKFGHAYILLGISRPHSYALAKDREFKRRVTIFDVAGVQQANVGELKKYKQHRKRVAMGAMPPKKRPQIAAE